MFQKRLNFWCNKWISEGRRVTLVKSILEVIPIYWHSLAYITKGVLEGENKSYFDFFVERREGHGRYTSRKMVVLTQAEGLGRLVFMVYLFFWNNLFRI
jgi:hypothetical protein